MNIWSFIYFFPDAERVPNRDARWRIMWSLWTSLQCTKQPAIKRAGLCAQPWSSTCCALEKSDLLTFHRWHMGNVCPGSVTLTSCWEICSKTSCKDKAWFPQISLFLIRNKDWCLNRLIWMNTSTSTFRDNRLKWKRSQLQGHHALVMGNPHTFH